ncbi:MAG: hypothetical protein RSC76_00040 [Oscillospiraceae bacterium]
MDPQQELFTQLKMSLEAQGYAVYDGFLPPDGTPYPFVYLGDFRQTDNANKSAVFGHVYATIHVWSNSPKNRGTVSQMLLNIKIMCRKIEQTANFSWILKNMGQRILPDNTTKTPLLHGVVEAEYKFS